MIGFKHAEFLFYFFRRDYFEFPLYLTFGEFIYVLVVAVSSTGTYKWNTKSKDCFDKLYKRSVNTVSPSPKVIGCFSYFSNPQFLAFIDASLNIYIKELYYTKCSPTF
jgi:hypothetical protein